MIKNRMMFIVKFSSIADRYISFSSTFYVKKWIQNNTKEPLFSYTQFRHNFHKSLYSASRRASDLGLPMSRHFSFPQLASNRIYCYNGDHEEVKPLRWTRSLLPSPIGEVRHCQLNNISVRSALVQGGRDGEEGWGWK